MAEALLNIVLEPVLHDLRSLIRTEIGSLLGVDQEMRRLSSTLTTIQAVLEDAEEKQPKDKAINDWLQKLKDAAQVMDDILDDSATEAIRLEEQANKGKKCLFSSLSPEHLFFRLKIARKMKNISRKLDKIAEERRKLHLCPTVIIEREAEVMKRPETISIIPEHQVYGRKEEKEEIVGCLIDHASNFEDLSVYPIVGMGGLGKTTLAQFIFNDERVAKHFEPRIWVSIPEDFDLRRIFKAIIEAVTGHACDDMVLEALQRKVQELVERKRYLLVLDDVWNENPEKWNMLKYVVTCGSKGASILITTRLSEVASIMGTTSPHQLSVLSNDNCWELFRYTAFGSDKGEPEELVTIGKEIVKKCGGVPLAAKALGSLLRSKRKVIEWLSVKENILWSSTQGENNVMHILKLSYLNLPVKLRRCFAFCAIFPKGYEIHKSLLIDVWMANGFISSRGNLEVEDVGDEVWNELCWRSFFQDIKIGEWEEVSFKVHDLIHDLAQDVAAKEVCCINDCNGFTSWSERTHYISINTSLSANRCHLLQLLQVKSLKTCIIEQHLDDDDCLTCLWKCNSLRVLLCKGLNELPSSIGHLRHLRYLNLSSGQFKILPESICDLWNLQVLNLNYCYNLQRLPDNLTRLRALQHLHLIGCKNLSSLPSGIRQLTFLKTLNVYIVDKKKGFLLAELEHLKLRGELHIQHLEKVTSVIDAKKANMVNKNLDRLRLSWWDNAESESQGNAEQILEALEPHSQLKSLVVKGYGGIHFPQWKGCATFKYLYDVKLKNCDNCLQLSSLGKLPSLKKLSIGFKKQLRYVDEESYRGGAATGFKALEDLSLWELPNLERLSKEDGQNIFPCLSRMDIYECPKLLALPSLPSLGKLIIHGKCSQALPGSIHNLHNLESLSFQSDNELASILDGILRNLTSLKQLSILGYEQRKVFQIHLTSCKLGIYGMHKLRYVDEELYIGGAATGFKALEYLSLRDLPNLERLSKEDGQNIFSRLSFMDIHGCPKLLALPSLPSLGKLIIQGKCSQALLGSIHNLHNLESLCFQFDEELASFPDGMLRNLTSLKEISIKGYSQLKVFQIELTSLNALEQLYIRCCDSLELITEQTWQGLHSLKTLRISSCRKLKLSDGFQYLTSLRHLSLNDCSEVVEGSLSEILQHLTALQLLSLRQLPNLASLPDCFGSLSNLRSLSIWHCPKLMCLPISIQGLCNLERLVIHDCPELKKRCEKETGEDWHKIAHVRNIWVD